MITVPLEEGDLVQLRSGGPVMSVQVIDLAACLCKCLWFDQRGELQECSFALSALHQVNRGEDLFGPQSPG